MRKRTAALLIVGALLAGGMAVAWADGSSSHEVISARMAAATGPDPTSAPADRQPLRQQLDQCRAERRQARQSGGSPAPSQACQDLRTQLKARVSLRGKAANLFERADHGTLDVRESDGTYVTYTFDKGTVAAGTSGSQIVVSRPDGQTVTLKIDGATKFRGITSASELTVGSRVVVVSKAGTATMVGQRNKRGPAADAGPDPASADLGASLSA